MVDGGAGRGLRLAFGSAVGLLAWRGPVCRGLLLAKSGGYCLQVTLTMDLAERREREYECSCCNAAIQRMWNFVQRDGSPYAVYFANCYHHIDQPHDTWIDVILGTWGRNNVDDHVTFGCRVGPVVNSPHPAATLVQACSDGAQGEIHGQILSRERALAHPWLPRFWEVVDFVLENDPTVRPHLYGAS